MFLFFHKEQNAKNTNYFKGMLFEQLMGQYLLKSGYQVQFRRRRNSLEYDLDGTNRTTGQKVVGEAKALDTPISGQILSSFMGKLLPFGIVQKRVYGLFLSTSSLTPEADDYLTSVRELGITCKTGGELERAVRADLGFPPDESLFARFSGTSYRPVSAHLLSTETSTFVAVFSSTPSSVTPAYFTVFDISGQEILDSAFLHRLTESVPAIAPLEPTPPAFRLSLKKKSAGARSIPVGLAVGHEWTDYRLPAPPLYYVGRRELIQTMVEHVMGDKKSPIVQLKSRSGVGKSSTLVTLERRLSEAGAHTELHDARDVKSAVDVFSVVQRFIGNSQNAADFLQLERQIEEFASAIAGRPAVFIVDQFESTFAIPEVFDAYEAVALMFSRIGRGLVFCLARKNDQLTTYDETKISLERLNDISKPFELGDFTRPEAKELLESINAGFEHKLTSQVLAYVLEFAQGFPWLLKRTMAHILTLTDTPQSHQPELIASSLRLNDLFDEELEGLEENEKDYLVRIAQRLPADYRQLHTLFDEDPQLLPMLDKLTRSRLLRLTGATYDTYNDVFKEYLVYNKLPEFRQIVLYRLYPGSVMGSFHRVVKLEKFSIEDLEEHLDQTRGSVFNVLNQWRNLNLIVRDGANWSVPQPVLDVIAHGTLGEYLRKQVIANDVVARLLAALEAQGPIDATGLEAFMRESFPFVEATDQTWELYANVLRGWLRVLKLVDVTKGKISRLTGDRKNIITSLGNLANISRGGRGIYAAFVPTASWHFIETAVKQLLQGKIPQTGELAKAVTDLRNGGWYVDDELHFANLAALRDDVVEMLSNDPYAVLWKAAEASEPLLAKFREIVGSRLSDQTLTWRLKRLLNWAKALDIIAVRRYKY